MSNALISLAKKTTLEQGKGIKSFIVLYPATK